MKGNSLVTLYTWIPKPVEAVQAGILPDLGHCALAVGETYVSFWPEIDSVTGVLISPFKPRVERNPTSYAEECDPNGAYQQREADYQDPLPGLDTPRMLERWSALRNSPYDFASMNCSHVLLDLLRCGLSDEREDILEEEGRLDEPTDGEGTPLEKLFRFLRCTVASPVTDCTPELLRARVLPLSSSAAASVNSDTTNNGRELP